MDGKFICVGRFSPEIAEIRFQALFIDQSKERKSGTLNRCTMNSCFQLCTIFLVALCTNPVNTWQIVLSLCSMWHGTRALYDLLTKSSKPASVRNMNK